MAKYIEIIGSRQGVKNIFLVTSRLGKYSATIHVLATYTHFMQRISIGTCNSMICIVIFGINTMSDYLKLLYVISRAVKRDNFEISRVIFMPNTTYKS